jgi:hypothetical protein
MKKRSALAFTFIGVFAGGIIFTAASLVLAWTGPTSAPPNGNVAAPINVGIVNQVKNAGLGINSLAVFGNAILSGIGNYLNFGSTGGTSGYGFRDNAGTMEFKNSGGAWSSFGSGSGVPSGAVMAFNLASCPTGWTALTGATGRVIVGTGSNGTNSYTLGATGGADSRTLTVAQLPPHNHTVTDTYPGGSTGNGVQPASWPALPANGGATTQTTSSVGSGAAIDMRPSYIALLYCQKS